MKHHITEHIHLPIPPGAAFALVSDYARDPQWRGGVRTMWPSTAGPARAGTTTEEVVRFLGRTYRNPGRVTAVDGHRLSWEAQGDNVRASGERRVDARADGDSRFTYVLDLEVFGMPRPVASLLGRLYRMQVRKDLRRLRRLVQQGPQLALGDLAA
jgi:hypothetical protein